MSLLAKAGSFGGSGTTGNQAVTGVGFQPTIVIFWWNLLSADTSANEFVVGMGVGISSSDRRAAGNFSLDSQATSANAAWNQSTSCIYTPSGGVRANFVSMDSDGFTVNWISATGTVINYLALGGTDLTNVKSGAIAAKTTTGNQAYTGVGFEPTALILFAGKFSTDPLDQSTNGAAMIGFATSSSQRGCVAWRNKNGAATQVAKRRQSKSRVAISLTDTGVFTEADFVSFDADGFTLNFTTAGGSADVVYYIALRGPQFKVSSFNQPAATGNQGITGAGFTPKASLMLSSNNTTANNDATNAHALVSIGIATGTSARGCLWAGESDAVTPTVTDRNLDRTKCIKMISNSSVTVNAAADHVSFDSDGQTINWTTADSTARETLVLWIGDASANTISGNAATAQSGTFTPSTVTPLSGVGATSAVGTLGFNKTGQLAITGVTGTGAEGSVALGSRDIALSGEQIATGTGSLSFTETGSVGLTSASTTASAETVSPSTSLSLSGNQAAGEVDSVTASQATTGNLTGEQSHAETGTVAPNTTTALTGNELIAAVGSLTVTTTGSAELSGNAATGMAGDVTQSSAVSLSGISAAPTVTTFGIDVTINLTGAAATGEADSVGAHHAGTAALTSVQSTISLGSFGITKSGTLAITGNSAECPAGAIAPSSAIPLTSNSATSSVGSVETTADAWAALSGLAVSISAGLLGPIVLVPLSGVEQTGLAGSVIAPSSGAQTISGVQAQSSVGSLTVQTFSSAGSDRRTLTVESRPRGMTPQRARIINT